MTTIRNLVIASLFASVFAACFGIATSRSEEARFVPYRDAVKACGAEWRASDARKQVQKGEGRAAWNTFRAECVTRQGYVKGRKQAKAN